MTRLRLLVWLIALMALIAPPGMSAHAMMPAAEASSVDCPIMRRRPIRARTRERPSMPQAPAAR